MRISDWSSDVCSSDLVGGGDVRLAPRARTAHGRSRRERLSGRRADLVGHDDRAHRREMGGVRPGGVRGRRTEWKSVVEGTSLAVRVDLGGRRTINTKKNTEIR